MDFGPLDTPSPPELSPNAPGPGRLSRSAWGGLESCSGIAAEWRSNPQHLNGQNLQHLIADPGCRKMRIRFGNDYRSPWGIALAAIIAVSTMIAAIALLANRVVLVSTVDMTYTLATQTLVAVAVAGTLTQISLLSFMFVWEKYQQWRTDAQRSE